MKKKLFVGNLSWKMSDEDLQAVFAPYGEIEEAVIAMDKISGRSRGFGFVTFANAEDADAAIEALNGTDVAGRNIGVNEALPPKPRTDRFERN